MKKFKKYLPDGMPYLKLAKYKKSCWKNPVVIAIVIVLAAALIAGLVIALVKWAQKDEDILDEDWLLEDDDEDVFFMPNDGDFTEQE